MALADVLGFGEPLAPFDSSAPGASAFLVVRLALFFVIVACRDGGKPARNEVVYALAGFFIVSIVARIFVVPDLLVTVVMLFALVPRRLAIAATAVATLGIATTFVPPRPPRAPPSTVAEWRAKKNLWRARATALEAAKHESPPGEAYIVLATVDAELGRRDRARKVLEKVRAHNESEAVRQKADALEQSWHD